MNCPNQLIINLFETIRLSPDTIHLILNVVNGTYLIYKAEYRGFIIQCENGSYVFLSAIEFIESIKTNVVSIEIGDTSGTKVTVF